MRELRVFHGLVNYGTQAGLFAKELRNQGIEAISVITSDRYKRKIDIVLLHGTSMFERGYKHGWNWIRRFYWFFKYNTFHFYYGTSLFPLQLDLPLYRVFGKKLIFHYLGKDVKLYKYSVEKYAISNMAYSSGSKEVALKNDEKKLKRLKYETKFADMQIVCSPVYSEFVPNAVLIPLAIDLIEYPYTEMKLDDEIAVMHAPTSRDNKGTSFIQTAISKLISEGFKIRFILCENMPHLELKTKYMECNIFIDQVLGGYGTAAIEAMAMGRPTISYLRHEHFNENTVPGGIPIIVAHKDNIYEVLKETIINREKLPNIGKESRRFVERNHDVRVLTNRLITYYQNLNMVK